MNIEQTITNRFENSSIIINGKQIHAEHLPWNMHPTFHGVALKHLIKGEETNNEFSSHLVRIEPNCEIGIHTHAGKKELHEVLSGTGTCFIGDIRVEYQPGIIALVPADTVHRVAAGINGLYLLAKFIPALL